MNAHIHPVMAAALAPFAPRGGEAYAQRRADYFDECRLGMDCGPDDQDRDPDEDEEDDFEGAPV